MLVPGYGEHPEGPPAELKLMLLGCVGRKISPQLTLEARLRHAGAGDRHGAAIYLDQEAPSRAVPKTDPEGKVGNNTDLLSRALMRYRGSEQQRISSGTCL